MFEVVALVLVLEEAGVGISVRFDRGGERLRMRLLTTCEVFDLH